MLLTQEQQKAYEEQGYLLLPNCFAQAEVDIIKGQLPEVFGRDGEARVTEKDGQMLRSVYGSHTENDVFRRLSMHPRIVNPSRQLLDSDVYVYQFKINAKAAFGGDLWDWHQDYIFWNQEDGMPTPRVTNCVLFLDEVTEFNGPLFLIPGSHKEGILTSAKPSELQGGRREQVYADSPAWITSLTANLKYSLDRERVGQLVSRYGMVAPKGPAGSVLLFDSNIVHGSPNNISPFDRVVVIITFNSVENVPRKTESMRPSFLVGRDHTPVVPVADDALFV